MGIVGAMTTRPPRILLWILTFIALVAAGFAAYFAGRALAPRPERVATVLQNPQAAGDLTLVHAPTGTERSLADVTGEATWTLVFFGFVNCPDVCPLTMAHLAETYRTLGEPEDVQVVMITVDPQNDDPERLQAYVSGFHPDFVGLAGSDAQIAEAARRFFVGYAGTGRDIVHTEAVGLVDASGTLRAVWGQAKVPSIALDVADLLDGRPL